MSPPGPMKWTQEQLALLADARLPAAARIIGLILSLGPDEGMELAWDDVRAFFGPTDPESDDTIRRLMRRLEATGWVRRTTGGRGHSDTFRILDQHECGSNAPIRVGMLAGLSDRLGTSAGLSTDRLGTGAQSKAPPPPPIPPPPPPENARARIDEAFEVVGDTLAGCRGSLRDYLALPRVEGAEAKHAYVMSVAGLIEGTDERHWRHLGETITQDRAQIIAGCLNELRASDEVGTYFPGPPGDIRNLHSKVRYKVKSIILQRRDAGRSGPASPPRAPRTTIGIENQGEFRDSA